MRSLCCIFGCILAALTVPSLFAEQILIRDVRVFDGERVWPRADVTISGAHISSIKVSANQQDVDGYDDVIDGRDMTLLPGLLDAHFHSFDDIDSLKHSLLYGVTTIFDVFNPDARLLRIRELIEQYPLNDLPDYFSAGTCATAPNGHGHIKGVEAISSVDEINGWLSKRIKNTADYIKLVIEPGFFKKNKNTLDEKLIKALVEAIHEKEMLAIAHVSRTESARIAVDAGVDILAHTWTGRVDKALLDDIRQSGISVMPTISVYDGLYDLAGPTSMVEDLRLRNYFPEQAFKTLLTSYDLPVHTRSTAELQRLTKMLHRADIPLLVGSDATNSGTWPGATMHREMELMVESGMSPIAVLQAATANVADAFRKSDRGRIQAGKLADLLLVSGDPTYDIRATRNVVAVWRRGQMVERTVGLN